MLCAGESSSSSFTASGISSSRARARVVSRSKRLYLAEGTLEDARGREVARGSGAFMPSTIALTTDIGYR